MSESEVSSSFIDESEDGNAEARRLLQENQRLIEMNNQLQQSLENTKQQLKQALETSSSVENFSVQIKTLRNQLKEANSQKEKYIAQIKDLNTVKKTVAPAPEPKLSNENIQNLKNKIEKLKETRNQLISANTEQRNQIEEIESALKHSEKKRGQMKKKVNQVYEENQQLSEKLKTMGLDFQRIENEKQFCIQENEELKQQIQSIKSFNNDRDRSESIYKEEKKRRSAMFALFEHQLESQKTEIFSLTNQKMKMVSLIQNLHTSLCQTESYLEETIKAKESLEAKQKNHLNGPNQSFNFSQLEIPFEGKLAEECQKIIKMEYFNSTQRIQRLLNEASQAISDMTQQIQQLKSENEGLKNENEEEKSKANKFTGIINALTKELKKIAVTEAKINELTDCKDDQAFLSFVAERCQDSYDTEKESYPTNFFSIDNVAQRKQIILQQIQASDEVFSLFSAQFLANIVLRKQLQKAITSLSQKEDFNQFLRNMNCKNIAEITKLIEQLQSQVQQLTADKKQLVLKLKKLKKSAQKVVSNEADQSQIGKLIIQNETLQNEIEVLKAKIKVLTQELAIKPQEKSHNFAETNLKMSIAQLKSEIECQVAEINDLHAQIQRLNEEHENNLFNQAKTFKQREQILQKKIQDQLVALEDLRKLIEERKKKYQHITKKLVKQQEASLAEMNQSYEKSKESYNATIASLNSKIQQSREMSQNVMHALTESEKRNQILVSENSDMQLLLKKLEMKTSNLKESIALEKNKTQNQISAAKMSFETQLLDAKNLTKQKLQEQREDIYGSIAKELYAFYHIDISNVDEDTFSYIIEQVKHDLEKLNMLQQLVVDRKIKP